MNGNSTRLNSSMEEKPLFECACAWERVGDKSVWK